jgi:uncharacterized protein (DUF58 family)
MGQEFVGHARLLDRPDPRRLDVRATLRTPGEDWLVRVHRQRVGIPVHAIVDVSSSMRFGTPHSKIEVAADFVEALARSAFRVGDAVGLIGFDAHMRSDCFVPARHARGVGGTMAGVLAQCRGAAGGIEGLEEAAAQLAGRGGLVFVVSDFHWPLDRLSSVLEPLARSDVVPLVLWSEAEAEPPSQDRIAPLDDTETGRGRTLWLRPRVRNAWRDAVTERRAALARAFERRGLRPLFMTGPFDGDAVSRYFFEAMA